MKETAIWTVEKCDGSNYLEELLRFLLTEFSHIFGADIMTDEKCIVYNDPASKCPMLIFNTEPLRLRLSQQSLSFWAQTIFQLSHELCHYALRKYRKNKDSYLSWFEEIVCEAMSLYALQWSAENWANCSLSMMNPQFSHSIKDYLEKELQAESNAVFSECVTIEMLERYEVERSTDRPTHKNERNVLYYEMLKNPMECACLGEYYRYLKANRIVIDFVRWEKDNPSWLIRFMHKLQPCDG